MQQELAEVFSEHGPLARVVEQYRPRAAQAELAEAVRQALQTHGTLVAEAGTGTGKTWAYLVPALLGQGKALVSTGTRTLQDQLYWRDLPRLREALALPVSIALLKGRGNYVCHYHLERLQEDERALKSRDEMVQLRHIVRFAQQSKSGDKAELASVPEDADIWHRATSTRENCLGQDCPRVKDCFVLKARRQAQDADLVVVNHALFMADLALREEGVTDLLPATNLVVFDEAHQLPAVATRFLGNSLSTHQLLDASRMLEAAGLAQARGLADWTKIAKGLESAARALRLSVAGLENMPGRRATLLMLPERSAFDEAAEALASSLEEAVEQLTEVQDKHPDLAAALAQCKTCFQTLERWRPDAPAARQAAAQGWVQWVELLTHAVRLHSAPLSVAELFSQHRQEGQAWVLTSATLSVNGDFQHFLQQLGLQDAQTARWDSPFDYAAQGLLFVPERLPLPNHPRFYNDFVATLLPLAAVTEGGVLVLCTTLRAVEKVAQLLQEGFKKQGVQRTVLQQGTAARSALLEQFRSQRGTVLVGSASFWEGIDVPGEALTLVAIDKLPFAPPDDPVLEARLEACRREGGNPFMDYQLPEAAITLKQGAGRLIRTEADWGVLMVGDTRLVEKPYGRVLWRGLPPFSRTRQLELALDFIEGHRLQATPSLETSEPVDGVPPAT
ncbi:ATP-dependent DNA helicase [Pusillimonas sp. CC-YST705]|uniref:ATP-dependent DNA helicase n=1 Tax=Mesopusillimonas faecipullorum TaxID=2755040 RepID=A0ABS8CD26_9BURK|nr:ATP-dependent DNA helicase [Mesopusillimonas faecipullorum]MCB5363923.1 ATP-dependent DNA helicase [Mesopusillimonas faecipullorum]